MTHTDLLRQALDALELQEPAVGCPREREHWKRTAMPTMDALRAALAQPASAVNERIHAPAAPADTRKLCTCDGAGRGPGRACVVQAGGRLGDLWKCAKSAAPAVPADHWKSAVLDRLAILCMDAPIGEPPASILNRVIETEVMIALDPSVSEAAQALIDKGAAAPAVREPHEPYLCIKPACGPDCSGCNCAISPRDMRDYAVRYAILRNAPIDAIRAGGVFAGKTPDNVVINGEHLDAAVDALRGITGDSK